MLLDVFVLIKLDAEENTKLNDCFYEKKDWRACKDEVGLLPTRLTRPSVLSCWAYDDRMLTATAGNVDGVFQAMLEAAREQ